MGAGLQRAFKAARETNPRCEACGRFVPYSQMERDGGASFRFTPLNEFGPEESEWTCKSCVKKDRNAGRL